MALRTPGALALAAGLTLLLIALGVTLSHAPLTVARTSVKESEFEVLGFYGKGRELCQGDEVLPTGTSAIRLHLTAPVVGPHIDIEARTGSHVIARGRREAGWTGGTITIPIGRVTHTSRDVTLCITTGADDETVSALGEHTGVATAATSAGKRLVGRVKIDYLRAAGSWWSQARAVARRMGLGHAPSGASVAILFVLFMATAAALASWLVIRETREQA